MNLRGIKEKPVHVLKEVGEVTVGVHGSNRFGGNAMADGITDGRVAEQMIIAKAK